MTRFPAFYTPLLLEGALVMMTSWLINPTFSNPSAAWAAVPAKQPVAKAVKPPVKPLTVVQPAKLAPAVVVAAPTVLKTGVTKAWQSPQKQAEAIVMNLIAKNNLNPSLVQAVAVQESGDLNAFTDGKNIVVTTALWNQLKDEDERAFVLGHELSHICKRHLAKGRGRQVGWAVLRTGLSVLGAPGVAQVAAGYGSQLLDRRFSRGDEYQADDYGLQLMMGAGYNPQAALAVFDVLAAAGSNNGVEFLQTHPLSRSRITSLVKKYKLNPNARANSELAPSINMAMVWPPSALLEESYPANWYSA